MRMLSISLLMLMATLSGCIVVPSPPPPVYVRPVYVVPPVRTAVIVTRPVTRSVIITKY
jgi:hypothetical protein